MRAGRKCRIRDLLSRYSRKVICTNVTTEEEWLHHPPLVRYSWGRCSVDQERHRQETLKGAGWVSTQEKYNWKDLYTWKILEQANEWRACLFSHFLDFEKAFDYVHIASLWNVMRSNGVPDKMVRVIVGIYMVLSVPSMTGVWHHTGSWSSMELKWGAWCQDSYSYCLGLGHEKGKADTRDKVESDNSAGGHWDFTDEIAPLSSKFSVCTRRLVDWRRKQPE